LPLVALLDGQTVVSVDLPDERWASIHRPKEAVGLACVHCDGTMIAKQRLIRFFAHRTLSPNCPTGRESEAHILLKLALRDAVLAAGWEADLEFTSARFGPQVGSDRWVADVLATSPGRQPVALEAQLANQSVFEAQERTERYLRNGVDIIWFARQRPAWARSVPAVAVSSDNVTIIGGLYRVNDAATALDEVGAPLDRFVGAYLSGEVTTTPLDGEDAFVSKVGLARFAAAEEQRLVNEAVQRAAAEAAQAMAAGRRAAEAIGTAANPLHVTSALVIGTLIGAGFEVGPREHHGSVDLVRLRGGARTAVAIGGRHPEADFVIHVAERPPLTLPPGEGWTDPLVQRFAFGAPAIARPVGEWNLRRMIRR
jgi:hypothetical protein